MGFSVTKVAQSFVRPSEPTPSETLNLSAIDRIPGLKCLMRSLHVFKRGQQPAEVIREALSRALVPYHPLAGRFIVSERDESMIECNGEGAWFAEAVADFTLEDVRYLDRIPLMISEDELLPEPPPGTEPLDVPIMMQVTEFKCGGSVVGFVFNHGIVDGIGAAQFLNAVGDFARGNVVPAINPIWCRHLIPKPPRLPPGPPAGHEQPPLFNASLHAFDLPVTCVAKIKSHFFESTGHSCTTFEISAAVVWQSYVRTVDIHPETPVHLCSIANVRRILTPHVLPPEGGYYGNCVYPMLVSALSGDIIDAEVVDVVKMIQDGKARLPDEFERWKEGELTTDPWELPANFIIVTDWTNLGFSEVDYGWGKPVRFIPLADCDFDVLLARPSVIVRCLREEHVSAFQEHVNRLL